MKVTIATGLYPPEIGGPATHTKFMEDRLGSEGYQVRVVAFRGSRSLPKIIRHIHYAFRLGSSAREADFIFAQDVLSVGLPAVIVAKILNRKIVVRVPGDYAWEQSTQRYGIKEGIDDFQNKKYGFRVEVLRLLQKYVVRRADLVIVPSNYFKNIVSNWGVNKERVHTVYNGVDLSITPKTVSQPEGLLLVTACRLVPWKGVDKVIRSLCDLPEWSLVVLGDGPERGNLEEVVSELDLGSRVHFKGAVNKEEVFGWCGQADAFILNTGYEGLSHQLVEVMSLGTPIITTAVGGNKELITDGVEGVMIEQNNVEQIKAALKSVVIDKVRWQERTQAAKTKAAKFSKELAMDNLISLLKEYFL
jgi:glycosyltransferase involved in cell wall biosynthesis